MAGKKRKPLVLKVALDTSCIYSGSASDLLQKSAADVIGQHSTHLDVEVEWYLPQIVVFERQFQMESRGRELLPAIQKMEKLLGHNLNINEGVVTARVSDTISRQIATFGLRVLQLDQQRVDWPRILRDAAFRKPPFETGDKEKGFRDAMIGESFIQLVEDAPATPTVCRLALVSNDALLREMVELRTANSKNVRVLTTLPELAEFINTLASDITEDFVTSVHPQAAALFFIKDDKKTLYYVEAIDRRIQTEFGFVLGRKPLGTDGVRTTGFTIHPPRFVRKESQRIYWTSRVDAKIEAFKSVAPATEPMQAPIGWSALSNLVPLNTTPDSYTTGPKGPTGASISSLLEYFSKSLPPSPPLPLADLGESSLLGKSLALAPAPRREIVVGTGQATFDISWSVSLTTSQKLTHPKVENIVHVETTWTTA